MYQSNYNYYPQNQQQVSQQSYSPYLRQAPPQIGLKGRPISSLEEVRAASIDFDGSIFYFPDLANKRIYTKQINIDGTASLNMYELKDEAPMSPSVEKFVTRDEFQQVLAEIRQSLGEKTAPAQPQRQEVLNF